MIRTGRRRLHLANSGRLCPNDQINLTVEHLQQRKERQGRGDLEAEFWIFSDITVSYFEVTRLTFRLAGVFLAGVRVLAAGLALAFPLPIASRTA